MEVLGTAFYFLMIIYGILFILGRSRYAKTFDPDYDEDEEWSMPKKKKKKH